jgi:hypothetical protein
VTGSFICAALHSAWIEYIAEPSPMRPITRCRALFTIATPTAAGMECPSPPLSMV